MGTYETELGYIVREQANGLDVYDDNQFICELNGKNLDDYRDEDTEGINDDKLETDIKEQVEVQEFLDDQRSNF